MIQNELLTMEGTVCSLIYQNEESGYTVLRILRDDSTEEAVAVGCMPYVSRGERIQLYGEWTTHASYGEQFAVRHFERSYPREEKEMLGYLSGGAIKGIGPKTAERIVRHFGMESLFVITSDPAKLTAISGITDKKAKEISREFNRRESLRVLTDFLVSNSLSLSLAFRLYKRFGEFALEELKKNPYLICGELFGEDFADADRLARFFGFLDDDPMRVDAGVLYELSYNMESGHAFIPREKLVSVSCGLLSVGESGVRAAVDRLAAEERIIIEEICNEEAVYLSEMYKIEQSVAKRLLEFSGDVPKQSVKVEEAIKRAEKKTGLSYDDAQKEALTVCAGSGLTVLTGGPGTGKTTTVRGMLELFEELGLSVSLCAPTGRAAKRLSELCGRDASTVHRLLESVFYPDENRMVFLKNEKNPLEADVVIVDETSMLDLTLAAALLYAVRPGTKLIFVGDADQLPSVGPGNFLRDLIASDFLPVIRLTKIFRQARKSDIIVNAHRINRGEIPDLKKNSGDFFFIARRAQETLLYTVCELCTKRIPDAFSLPVEKIQVLCPSRIGPSGTNVLNHVLQAAVNPASDEKKEISSGTGVFREGDRVLQTRNNYDLFWRSVETTETGTGIFNGEIGKIIRIDLKNQMAVVLFDDKTVDYPFSELSQLELSYAMTAHKAQGSEFEAVVLCLLHVPKRLQTRSILYTAVTRAKKLLVIVGDVGQVDAMVKSDRKTKRYSALRARLSGEGCK